MNNGDLIIYTRDTHFENYLDTKEGQKLPVKHCIVHTDGWHIPDELRVPATYEKELIVDKFTFGSTDLPHTINRALAQKWYDGMESHGDITEIELVGLCTDICVVSNALLLKAQFFGHYDISVDATCCAGVTPETHEAALKTMEMCQINVKR
jgi:nicotinamidase-related amidase